MAKVLKIRSLALGEGRPKICVPLTGPVESDLLGEIAEVKKTVADLVEWRVDHFSAVDDVDSVKATLRKLRAALGDLPLLFTFRTKGEGGVREMVKERYLDLNLAVAASGDADLLDIELFTGDDEVKRVVAACRAAGVKVVVSSHDFQKTPPRQEIVRRLGEMRRLGGDVPKVAVMPQSFADVLTLLAATDEYVNGGADCPVITMSMKRLGCVSRVAGEFSGSSLTFGSVRRASAPGQLAVDELATILDILHRM